MDNQNIYVGNEQRGIVDEQPAPTAHQLQKQERRLLERLREAQEAETRAIERFKRAQAKLERRKARIQRLAQRLTQLREGLADLQAGMDEHSSAPGDYSDYDTSGEQRDEHTANANGYVVIEEQPPEVSFRSEPVTPIPAFEPAAAEETGEDAFEPEVYMTPELHPTPEVVVEHKPETTSEAEIVTEPAVEAQAEATPEVEATAEPLVEPEAEATSEAEATEEPLVEQQAEATPEVEAVQEPAPEHDQADVEDVTEASIPSVEAQSEIIMPETPALDAAAPEIQATDDSPTAEPSRAINIRSLELAVREATEIWQKAEAGVSLAQNRRQELASSIAVLAQANLSGALMDELLRKQSEANRAWVEAKEQERIAAEKLAQAETAYRYAQ
jgi:hypothetical protein